MSEDLKIVWISTRAGIAAAIAEKFNVAIVSNHVAYWKKCVPPFPEPRVTPGNRNLEWNRDECFEWYRKFVESGGARKKTNVEAERAQGAKNRMLLLEEKRAQMEFDRDVMGKLIDRDKAQATTNAVLKTLHEFVKGEFETRLPDKVREKMQELGCSQEVTAAMHEFILQLQIETINRIEERCEKKGNYIHCYPKDGR